MKKLLWIFVAVVAIAFSACGNSTNACAGCDSDSVAVDTLCVDSAVVDTVAE